MNEDGDVRVFGKHLQSTPALPHYRVWKRYYDLKSSPDMKKIFFFPGR